MITNLRTHISKESDGYFLQQLSIYEIWNDFLEFEQAAINKYHMDNLTPIRAFIELVERFHEFADINTENVRNSIIRLSAGAPIIRIFHQPNTIAALNIIGLLDLARYLMKNPSWGETQPVILFIALDYDKADDKRFRNPVIPTFSKDGLLSLKGVVPNKIKKQIACAIRAPQTEDSLKWIKFLEESAKYWRPVLKKSDYSVRSKRDITDKSKLISEAFSRIYVPNNSITLANTMAIAWFIVKVLNLDVLFIPASWLLQYSYDDILFLLSIDDDKVASINRSIRQLYKQLNITPNFKEVDFKNRGVWRLCNNCYVRKPITIVNVSSGEIIGEWRCDECGIETTENLNKFELIDTHLGAIPKVIPSVMVCNLLETISYRFQTAINYAGSIQHLLLSKVACRELDIPMMRDYIWEPSVLFDKSSINNGLDTIDRGLSSEQKSDWVIAFQEAKFPTFFYWMLFSEYDIIFNAIVDSVTQ